MKMSAIFDLVYLSKNLFRGGVDRYVKKVPALPLCNIFDEEAIQSRLKCVTT